MERSGKDEKKKLVLQAQTCPASNCDTGSVSSLLFLIFEVWTQFFSPAAASH